MYGQDVEFAMWVGGILLVLVVILQICEMIFEPNKWK